MIEAWRRTRKYFLVAVAIFALGVLYGGFLPLLSRPVAAHALSLLQQKLAPMAGRVRGAATHDRVLLILRNNLRVGLLALVSGPSLILPGLFLLGNGLALGLMGASLCLAGRLSLGQFALAVLPHGVFELPAVFLVASLGWRWGMAFWRRLLMTQSRQPEAQALLNDTAFLGLVALGLFLVAALLEVLVTPAFLPARLG